MKFKKALKKVEATRQSFEAKKTPKRAHSVSKIHTNEAKNTESVAITEVNQTTDQNKKQEPVVAENQTATETK